MNVKGKKLTMSECRNEDEEAGSTKVRTSEKINKKTKA